MSEPTNERRRKIVPVCGALFAQMFHAGPHDGYDVVANALPSDARLVGARMADFGHPDTFELLFESAEFEPVADGQPIPRLAPTMRRVAARDA